ncbi:hypothetical protein ADEAN_001000400 [Angomonas deanei]|uniref:Uncharacterized protein n=1 Tax=Angomonas deanei TaxID=59799 RepID=A0A7G2CRT4_9TRYP|nr:hypothetical protein ADEAN_001000400 [Angomonas deanei]
MSVSGQWYPQGSTPPPQWSPPGTPGGTATNFPPTVATSPWGGYLPGNLTPEQQLAQQQQMQVQMQMQQQQAQAAGGQPNNLPPGMPPGMQGMPPGMPGMPPGYPMQQDCCASCCGPQGSAGCCGPTGASCCGPTGAGCCGPTGGGCCGPQQGQCCQCQMPGEPPDPYLCSPPVPGQTSCYECIYNSFDYTFLMMIICAALSVVGFGVVLGTKGMDDLFTTFGSVTTTELDEALIPHIIWRNADLDHPNITNTTTSTTSSSNKAPRATSSSHSRDSSESTSKDSSSSERHSSSSSSHEEVPRACTLRKLAGSFGGICMEDNLNANMFVVQLSHWNNARDTLWFLAMVYSVLSLLFAFLIHIQRNPSSQTGFPVLTPEKQQEFMAMTPAQQQAFMQQLQLEQGQAAQQQSQGCCGRKRSRGVRYAVL